MSDEMNTDKPERSEDAAKAAAFLDPKGESEYKAPEEDKIANKMGIKGIGELGITSVAASIANAVFNATGKRMRELPLTPEKMIMKEESAA